MTYRKKSRLRSKSSEHIIANFPEAFKFLFEPSRYKIMPGGRASGKSNNCAGALILKGVEKELRWLLTREIQKSLAASVKQLLVDKIKEYNLKNFYTCTENKIVGVNGTMFLFAGLRTNPESIKSMEGLDGAWIEEADTCTKRSLDILFPTIRKPKSEIWATYNRRNTYDPIDDLFMNPKVPPPPNSIIKEVNYLDNPFFPEVLKDEMEWLKKRDYEKWLHIWGGQPLTCSEARVFKNWRIDDLDDQIPKDSYPLLGADWGFSVDPTTLVACHIFGRTLYIKSEIYKVKCEIDELPSLFYGNDTRAKKRWDNKFNHKGLKSVRDGFKIVADSARPETISYMKNRGFNIIKAKKGPGSIKEGISFIQSYDIVVHPDCVHTRDELFTYNYLTDKLTGDVLPVLGDSFNNMIDAIRYAVEGARRVGQKKYVITKPIVITY